MTPSNLSRRNFVKSAGVASAATLAILPSLSGQQAPSRKLRVGVMGLQRGLAHIRGFQAVPNVEIAYVCDVDSNRLADGAALANKGQKKPTQAVGDFRKILEDQSVDILSIATPNFWHAPATILGCAAGKHVYVEKPGSYSAEEGELMVQAARKYDRKVQMGTQRRSYESMIIGMEKLHGGAIGKLRFARSWYKNARESIGKGKQTKVPDYLDYDLWQGPVPEQPYKDNLVHYNWHWHWNYGGGELANNGVHALDIIRWGLQVEYPTQVTYLGGRYNYDDDQETPDTAVAQYNCGEVGATWDGSSCQRRNEEQLAFCTFYGDEGTMAFDTAGYKAYDPTGRLIDERAGTPGDVPHFQNFCDAIRDNEALNQDIEEGQKSTHWCHLGNIAYRTQSVIKVNPDTGQIKNNPEAQKLWKRNYRNGWQPKV
jgi:predicted dehydrogenase